MSRYSHTVTVEGKDYTVSYGYDRPLSEYFLQVEDCGAEDDDGLLFAISSYNTMKCHPDYPGKFNWSNGELIELFVHWEVPFQHTAALASDMPF